MEGKRKVIENSKGKNKGKLRDTEVKREIPRNRKRKEKEGRRRRRRSWRKKELCRGNSIVVRK